MQKPTRAAQVMVGTAASKIAAAGMFAAIFTTVGSLGMASTGVAIGTLSGAAYTTATLYWIGSIFGLGVAGGGAILTGGAILAAIPAANWARRRMKANQRDIEDLSGHEQALVYAALRLATALHLTGEMVNEETGEAAKPTAPSRADLRVFSKIGLAPLLAQLRSTYFDEGAEEARIGRVSALRLRYSVEMLELISTRCFER